MPLKHSPTYTCESNGTSGRLIQKLCTMTRIMLFQLRFSEQWGAAIIPYSNRLQKKLSLKEVGMSISYVTWYNQKSNLSAVLAFAKKSNNFQHRSGTIGDKNISSTQYILIYWIRVQAHFVHWFRFVTPCNTNLPRKWLYHPQGRQHFTVDQNVVLWHSSSASNWIEK